MFVDSQGKEIRPGRYIYLHGGIDNYLARVYRAGGELWAELNGDTYVYQIGCDKKDFLRVDEW